MTRDADPHGVPTEPAPEPLGEQRSRTHGASSPDRRGSRWSQVARESGVLGARRDAVAPDDVAEVPPATERCRRGGPHDETDDRLAPVPVPVPVPVPPPREDVRRGDEERQYEREAFVSRASPVVTPTAAAVRRDRSPRVTPASSPISTAHHSVSRLSLFIVDPMCRSCGHGEWDSDATMPALIGQPGSAGRPTMRVGAAARSRAR